MVDNIAVASAETVVLEVELRRDNTKLAPRSIEELEQWLQREHQFWGWLIEARSEDTNLDFVVNLILHQQKHVARALQEAKNSDNPDQRRQAIENLRGHLFQRYVTQQAPTSESPISQYAAELAKKDKVAAAHALWALLGNDPQGSNKPARAFRGQVLAALYQYDAGSVSQSHAAAWAQVRDRASSEHEALRTEATRLSEEYRCLMEDIRGLHENQRKEFNEAQATRATEFTKLTTEHTSTMKNIEGTFKRELSLRSAVDYLNTKADQHRTVAWIAGVAAFLVGTAFSSLAAYVGLTVFKDEKDLPIPQIAVAVLAATLVFWMLRILVRVLLSHLHLRTDMRARSTFVHTYLALLAEGGGIKDEDRALVIGLVFRPISDGLVRDDATPPGLWDLVTKNLSGRG